MVKIIQKYVYQLIISLGLLLVAVYFAEGNMMSLPYFQVHSPKAVETQEISIFDANDGHYYVFLPSYAEMEQVTISLPNHRRFSLGDTVLSDGMDCSVFELGMPYSFAVNKRQVATLSFHQSANVATMYIDTATGSMEHIHKDKEYKEQATVVLYTTDGEINYSDGNSALKGRGNSTWKRDKRPYSLTLASSERLLDMGAATDWCLLANFLDHSNLNNKVVYDLANRVGFLWTPKCEYVDVYLNGAYNGLYLLAEKVEIGADRLNIDPGRGDFLCAFDFASRIGEMRNHLRTEKGRTVEICEPEILTQEEKQRIEDLVNQQEQDILSGNIGSTGSIVDMDSWIRRYLIDEIAGNTDADLSSSYFYCTDGKLYAGPVWDYDTAFGNTIQNANPQAFTAKNRVKYGDLIAPFYSVLFAHPVFYDRMAEIYQQEFLPVLNALIAHDIQNLADTIHSAATANSIRWPVIPASQSDFSTWVAYSTSGDTIRQYLRQKVDFLNDALINRVDYATLQFQLPDGGAYWSASVPVGAVLEKTDVINEPFYSEIAKGIWLHADTAEVIALSRPITRDMILVRPVENTEPSVSLISDDSIIILSVAMLLVMFVTFITIDVVQRCKERRGTNERK